MLEVDTDVVIARYAPCRSGDNGWAVVDQERADQTVLDCPDAAGAALIAGLMNGDLAALAAASPETLASCLAALAPMLRGLRPHGRPLIGVGAFPRL